MLRFKKLLSMFNEGERRIIEVLIKKIISLDWRGLNVKKLRGCQDIFRLRKGKIRIIFTKNGGSIYIFAIERRREDTYKF